MKTLAALFSLLGVLALMTPQMLLHPRSDEAVARAVALNFCLYRNAVNHYVIKHPTTANGILVPKSLLDLPSGWKSLRAWTNRPDGGTLYVWGPVNENEAGKIMDMFNDSYAVGIKRNGSLVTDHGIGIALPDYIPSGSIVSVITP